MESGRSRLRPGAQLDRKNHLHTSPDGAVEQFASRHVAGEHFLEAHRLGTELNFISIVGLWAAALVLDWVRRAAWVELHHICNTEQAQSLRTQLQSPLVPNGSPYRLSGLVNTLMQQSPLNSSAILSPQSLKVDQSTLPFAELQVLQRRNRQEIAVLFHLPNRYISGMSMVSTPWGDWPVTTA